LHDALPISAPASARRTSRTCSTASGRGSTWRGRGTGWGCSSSRASSARTAGGSGWRARWGAAPPSSSPSPPPGRHREIRDNSRKRVGCVTGTRFTGWSHRVLLPDTAEPAGRWVPPGGSYNPRAMTKGDRERFEAFVRTSRRAMLRIAQNLCRASGVDPEDLVEETLERAFGKLEHGAGADPLALPFVATVMTHRYIDLCRRRRAEGVVPEPAAPEAEGEVAAV